MGKFIKDKNHWLDSFTSCFLGTLLGILVTFGSNAIIQHKDKVKLEERALMITLNDIKQSLKYMNVLLDSSLQKDSVYQIVYNHYIYGADTQGFNDETLDLFYKKARLTIPFAFDNSAENIFTHNIEIWETLEDPALVEWIGLLFSLKKDFFENVKELDNLQLDVLYKYTASNINKKEFIAKEYLEYPETRYFICKHHSDMKLLKHIVRRTEDAFSYIKEGLHITDEEIDSYILVQE